MDVRLPDGTVIRNVPEGTSKEQLVEKLSRSGYDVSALKPKAQEQPKQEPSRLLQDAAKLARGFLQMGPLGMAAVGVGGAMESIDKAAEAAGGYTTDVVAKVAPPEAAAVAGTAVRMLPTALGGMVGRATGAPVMEGTAKKLMHSALKPSSKDIISGDAAKAVDTLLKENANVSARGATKLREAINKLSGEVARKIAESPATVDKANAASEVYKTLQKFRSQVNPGADTQAILKSWQEFNQTVANKIPVAEAQALKQGTYKVLSDKYAKMGAVENEAATQAQMSMARGLRKGIEEAVPGVGQLNAKESALINALEMTEKRAGISGNKDIGGIAWLANNPTAAAAMMADRSSAFKSWLANKIYQYRNSVPRAAGVGAAGTYQASQQE